MQPHATDHPADKLPQGLLHTTSVVPSSSYSPIEEPTRSVIEPTRFYNRFVDCMEMYADRQTVAAYFDLHQEWFRRCAHPMKVEAIGDNSYALVIGRFGSFGYEIEPKIGLDLLPQQEGVYRIETVPVPNYVALGYDVDFQASMELVELPTHEVLQGQARPQGKLPERITRVQWQLDLTVMILFPRFIHALPKSLIQTTGDQVLGQVVRQVSNRLTRKVQEDFHKSQGVPLPKPPKRWFFRKTEQDPNVVIELPGDLDSEQSPMSSDQ